MSARGGCGGAGQVGKKGRRRAFLRANMGESTRHGHMLRWQRGPPWGMYRGAGSTGRLRRRVEGSECGEQSGTRDVERFGGSM